MKEKYRVGVIGHTGRGNYGHGLDTVWLHLPECEIVAVADAHEGGLKKALERLDAPHGYADYRKMLDEQKPDIVSICPRWLDQHHDMVVACAERGIHMYIEKPLCRTLAEADAMVAACRKNKVKLAIAYQTRYSPKLPVIRRMIEDGAIGDLAEVRARGKEDHRGGSQDLWVLGSHLMNLMHYFAGEPLWCFARLLQDGRPVTAADVQPGAEGIGPLAGDNVAAVYGLAGGATGYFGSREKGGPGGSGRRFGLRLFGTAGVLDLVTGFMPAVYYLDDPSWSTARTEAKWIPVSSAGPGKPEPLQQADNHEGNRFACLDLLTAIEQDRQPEASIYEARTSTEMIVAVFESHRQGGVVPLPLANRQNPLAMLGRSEQQD